MLIRESLQSLRVNIEVDNSGEGGGGGSSDRDEFSKAGYTERRDFLYKHERAP